MKLLGLSGSLRAESTNTRLLSAATHFLPPGVEMHLTQLSRLPHFNPDVEVEESDALSEWVQEVRSADGLIVSTPEYARGYPGTLKNALDWLVGTDAFVAKPFMLLKATARSDVAQQTLTTVLETMSGIHVAEASATIPLLGTALSVEDIVRNEEFAALLRSSISGFVEAAIAIRAPAMPSPQAGAPP